jgi:hypothetical protein
MRYNSMDGTMNLIVPTAPISRSVIRVSLQQVSNQNGAPSQQHDSGFEFEQHFQRCIHRQHIEDEQASEDGRGNDREKRCYYNGLFHGNSL